MNTLTRLVATHDQLQALRALHKPLFDLHDKLAADYHKELEALKLELRADAPPAGSTAVIVDDDKVKVQVISPADEVSYDVELAEAIWSEKALEESLVKVVDVLKVKSLVEAGVLPARKANAAMVITPSKRAPTVRVDWKK